MPVGQNPWILDARNQVANAATGWNMVKNCAVLKWCLSTWKGGCAILVANLLSSTGCATDLSFFRTLLAGFNLGAQSWHQTPLQQGRRLPAQHQKQHPFTLQQVTHQATISSAQQSNMQLTSARKIENHSLWRRTWSNTMTENQKHESPDSDWNWRHWRT